MTFKAIPLTTDNFDDLCELFGKRGACAGCWCTYWQQTQKNYKANKGDGNKALLESWVSKNHHLGLLGFFNGEPAGWCAFGPRTNYPRLGRSRILKPVDDTDVVSIVCFFIAKRFRRQGLGLKMILAARDFSFKHGATVLEGYPVDPVNKPFPDAFAFTGTARLFEEAGFKEVERRSPTRPIMRLHRPDFQD